MRFSIVQRVVMPLRVTYQELMADDRQTPLKPAAWRVGVDADEEGEHGFALPLEFARKRDAQRARAALISVGLDELSALLDAGEERCVQIMVESLAW